MVSLPLTIEYALLGFLHQRPMHGYEIHQHLSDAEGLGSVWRIKQSKLYALLAKLDKEGYITSSLQPQEARPPRKIFRLTSAGRDIFMDWIKTSVPHGRDIRLEFLAKLYFAKQVGAEIAAQLIEEQWITCRGWLAAQQSESEGTSEGQSYLRLIQLFRIGQIEAIINWLDHCERILNPDRPIE